MTLRVFLHDDGVSPPGTGEDGPTHAATIKVDYEYQVEQWVIETTTDLPHIVRIRCPELNREWLRGPDGKFAETEASRSARLAREWAWIQAMVKLEEERGEIVPGGAQGDAAKKDKGS